jgi:hypothetical protein
MSGLQWLKWDLHIHTPYSKGAYGDGYGDKDSSNDLWDKFIEELNNSGLDVIGINDYGHLCGYHKIKAEYDKGSKGKLCNIKAIFPVIELRVDRYPEKKDSKHTKINYHLLFNPELDEDEMLALLRKISDTSDQCKTKQLCKIEDFHKSRINPINAIYKITEIQKLLEGNNNVLQILSRSEWSQISNTDPIKNDLVKDSDLLFSSSDFNSYEKNKSHFLLAKEKKIIINTSDKHNFKDNEDHCNNFSKFTWIKASPTFKGLKFVLDRQEDVFVGQYAPSGAMYHISSIKYDIPNHISTDTDITLNKGLISIIGNKGTGKSLLGASIAKKCNINSKDIEEIDKSYHKIFSDGSYRIEASTNTSEDNRISIKYLSQHYINTLTDIGNSKLDKEIENIIFSYAEDIEELSRLEENIENYKSNLFNTEIFTKEEELKKELEDLKKELEDLELKIKTIDDQIKKDDEFLKSDNGFQFMKNTKELDEKNKKIQDLLSEVKVFSQSRQNITDLQESFKKINIELENIDKDIIINTNIEDVIRKIDDLITNTNQKIETLKSDSRKLKDNTDQIKADYPNITNLSKLTEETSNLKILKDKISHHITENKNKKESNRIHLEDHKNLFIQYIDLYHRKLEFYEKIKERFEEELEKEEYKVIDKELKKITFEVGFDIKDLHSQYSKIIKEHIDKRKLDALKLVDENDNLQEHLLKYEDNDIIAERFYEEIINNFYNENIAKTFKGGINSQEYLRKLFNVKLEIKYRLLYENQSIQNSSTGQKGTAITLLLLLFNKNNKHDPIIIDQPEDNLDNQTIHDTLVPAFKLAKQFRQIFLITHNPNLVINTDSDQIIVARKLQEGIEYTLGTLDNPCIIELLCKILEGGKEALKKRSRTYEEVIN